MSADCSKCRRRERRKQRRQTAETPEYTAMLGRVLRAYSRRVGDGDLDALGDLARLGDEVDGHVLDAVARLRDEPWAYSWQQIGEALGITRQSAQERFRKAGGARRPGGQPSHRR